MQLERIAVALRPRTSREAMDLGIALLRTHAGAVWRAWFALSLPCFVLVQGAAWLAGFPWLGLLLTWWLLPVFDRVPLFVLSHAVFEQVPALRATLRGQARWPWGPTLAALSWRRVDSNRVLRLPLDMLEGLPPRQRAARWRVLRKPLVGTASGLAWTCLLFVLAAFASVWLMALLCVPNELQSASLDALVTTSPAAVDALWCAAGLVGYLAFSAIEPVHVAAGFALYLNRRTQLEAWDIDLAFRRLRARLLATAAAVVLVLCMGATPMAQAATQATAGSPSGVSTAEQQFAHAVRTAYEDPRFGREESRLRWVPRETKRHRPQPPVMAPVGNLASGLFNGLLWLLLAAGVVALAVFAWRQWGSAITASSGVAVPLAPARTDAAGPEPLPGDLDASVRALWQAGQRREALALLYRGAVARVAAVLQIPESGEATEADWLQRARALDDAQRARFAAIVRAWQYAAYAGRYPDQDGVDCLLAGWPVRQEAA